MKQHLLKTLIIQLFILSIAVGQERITDWNSAVNTSSNPSGFITYNNKVYFTAINASDSLYLWVTDGTSEGTRIFLKGNNRKSEFRPIKLNGKLYFLFDKKFWSLSENETLILKDKMPTFFTPYRELIKVENRLYIDTNNWYNLESEQLENFSEYEHISSGYSQATGGSIHSNEKFLLLNYYPYYGRIGNNIEVRSNKFDRYYKMPFSTHTYFTYSIANDFFAILFNNGKVIQSQIYPDSIVQRNVIIEKITGQPFLVKKADQLIAAFPEGNSLRLSKIKENVITSEVLWEKPFSTNTVVAISENSLYFISHDSLSNNNTLQKVSLVDKNIETIGQILPKGKTLLQNYDFRRKSEEFNGYILTIINDSREYENFTFSSSEEKMVSYSFKNYYISSSILEGKEIGSYAFPKANGTTDIELALYSSDTILIKNIKTSGKTTNIGHFSKDNKHYFLSNDEVSDLTTFLLDTTKKQLTAIWSKKDFVIPSLNFFGNKEGQNEAGIFDIRRPEEQNINIILNKLDEFELLDSNPESRTLFLSDSSEWFFIENEILKKYNFSTKKLGYACNLDTYTRIRQLGNYYYYQCGDSLIVIDSRSNKIFQVENSPNSKLTFWNDKLITVKQDSLILTSLINESERRFILSDPNLEMGYSFESTDSTFAIITTDNVYISDGSCEGTTKILSEPEHGYDLKFNRSSNSMFLLKKAESNKFLVFDSNLKHELSLEAQLYLSPIVINNGLYYFKEKPNSPPDSLMFLNFKTKEESSAKSIKTTKSTGFIINVLTRDEKSKSLLLAIGSDLFKIDISNGQLLKTELDSLDLSHAKLYKGKGASSILMVQQDLYSLNNETLEYRKIEVTNKNHNNTLFYLENNDVWVLTRDRQLVSIDKSTFNVKNYNFGNNDVSFSKLIPIGSQLYTIAQTDNNGVQVWYIDQFSSPLSRINENIPRSHKLPLTQCLLKAKESPLSKNESLDYISIFPNPSTNGVFTIQLSKEITNPNFTVINSRGLRVPITHQRLGKSSFQIKLKKTSADLKTLILTTNHRVYSVKLLDN